MKLQMVPHSYWIRAGILRAKCGLSYIELYEAAKNNMLERRVIANRVYYKSRQAPLFEAGMGELVDE